jgi:hypothetical protein
VRTDDLIAEIQARAWITNDMGLAKAALALAEEYIIMRDMALRMERVIHDMVKEAEKAEETEIGGIQQP